MARSSERRYDYTPASYEDTVDRAERRGSMFDSLLKDAKIYKSKQGANLLRILPQGWKSDKNHYGLTVWIHGDVGPDDRRYLCLRENPSSPYKRCPICEELYRLGSRATPEDKAQLRPKPNVMFYVIDRDNERDGVQVWMTSPKSDTELAAQSTNRRTKAAIDVVNPDKGYDLEFVRTGSGRNTTRYGGFRFAWDPSPLSDDERQMDQWLAVAFEKPLPELLNFYPPEHIERVFYGHEKSEDDAEQPRSRIRDRADEPATRDEPDERPARSPRDAEQPRDRDERGRGRDDDEDWSAGAARRAAADRPERPSRSRESVEEREESPRRVRQVRDDDGDDRAARGNGRARDDDPGEVRAERPARRRAAVEDDPEPDERSAPRRRTALNRELDDEIPSDGGRRARPNGRNGAAADDAEETPPAPRRRIARDDAGDERMERAERSPRVAREEPDPDEDRHQRRRRELRERVDRE